MTFDYPGFLAARLDERENTTFDRMADQGVEGKYELADIAAKRAILAEYEFIQKVIKNNPGDWEANRDYGNQSEGLLTSIRALSFPFKTHPDYPGDES